MDHIVKIDQKRDYVRITIPKLVVDALDLRKYPLARIRIIGEKTMEVEGVDIGEREKG
jgi:hypothetical protein